VYRHRVRWFLLIPALVGCGHLGFDRADADPGGPDAAGDAAALDPDLLVWLPLDDDPQAGVIDRAGTLGSGKCDAGPCPALVPGRLGGAYDFRGTAGGGAIRFDSTPLLDFGRRGQPMSVALWYRTRSISPRQQVAFAQPIAGGQVAYQIALEDLVLDGKLDVVFKVCATGCDNEAFTYANDGAELDVWRLVVGVWDGATSRLYIDGALRDTQPKSTIVFDGSPLYIGADLEVAGVEDVFEGLLDDVRVYKRALSVADQQALLAQ